MARRRVLPLPDHRTAPGNRPGPSRPKLAHALRGGPDGITYLVYGTRSPGEIVYYPRSRKAWLGTALVRIDLADDYWEGEI